MWRAARKLLGLSLLACTAGCGAFGVDTFSGSILALSFQWPLIQGMQQPQPGQPILPQPGLHLDLWSINSQGVPMRLAAGAIQDPAAFPGFNVLPAVDPNDPCLIDGDGNLLLAGGLALVEHVRDVVPGTTKIEAANVSGKAPVPLLAMVLYADQTRPKIDTPDPMERKSLCDQFLNDLSHQNYYLGNPSQFTSPLHGTPFGFLNFNTIGPMYQTMDPATFLPPQAYGGIAISTRVNLHDTQALLLTMETAQHPQLPNMVLPIFQGKRLPPEAGGRGAIRFALAFTPPPMGMPPMQGNPVVIGTASILTDLDQEID